MVAKDIDGKAIAAKIREEIRKDVETLKKKHHMTPGLAVISVNQAKNTQTYANIKKTVCAEAGFNRFGFDYNNDEEEEKIIKKIKELNEAKHVHGIIIQLPLPDHMDEAKVLHSVDPTKDVDGLHPASVASLYTTRFLHDWDDLNSIPFPIACTPQACVELLDRSNVKLEGKHAVIVGLSNLSMPLSTLLLHRGATVTVVHSRTPDIKKLVQKGDVVLVAAGKAKVVQASWLKEGCVVIDVGINNVPDKSAKKGFTLQGDVDYENARKVCSQITPVPGGVGPMTIAMLLRNTLNVFKRSLAKNNKK